MEAWRIHCTERGTGFDRSFVILGDRKVAEYHFADTAGSAGQGHPEEWIPRCITRDYKAGAEATARHKWNEAADAMNQWDALGEDEKNERIEAESNEHAKPSEAGPHE